MTEHEERAEAIRLLDSEGGSTLIPSALLSRLIVESQQRDDLLDALRWALPYVEEYRLPLSPQSERDTFATELEQAQRAIEEATA